MKNEFHSKRHQKQNGNNMNKKLYKDILAVGILLSIIGFMTGVGFFARYASEQAKEYFLKGLLVCLILFFLFAMFKLIRLMID